MGKFILGLIVLAFMCLVGGLGLMWMTGELHDYSASVPEFGYWSSVWLVLLGRVVYEAVTYSGSDD